MEISKCFVAYYFFVGWWCPLNIGFHISFQDPNIEIHLPFGFIRIGWKEKWPLECKNDPSRKRCFGLQEKFYDVVY
jgi:hypothetical protein